MPGGALPLLLLTNLVYHQTLCVLHASIVPLFCWTAGDDAWSLTRQTSAQVAYEHACTVSALIRAALASTAKISAMPTFVAYAAYGGCAILMPFMWCSNLGLRYQAQANVRTNIRMIHGMAEYWKFAALLVSALLLLLLPMIWLTCLCPRPSTLIACTTSTKEAHPPSTMNPSTLMFVDSQVSRLKPCTRGYQFLSSWASSRKDRAVLQTLDRRSPTLESSKVPATRTTLFVDLLAMTWMVRYPPNGLNRLGN